MPRNQNTPPTTAQFAAVKDAADRAYTRISKALEFDPDLNRFEAAGLSDYVARAQGALLDLASEIDARLKAAGYTKPTPKPAAAVEPDPNTMKMFNELLHPTE